MPSNQLIPCAVIAAWITFFGIFLQVFLWPIILICLVHSLCLVYLRILPCVRKHLLAKLDSTKSSRFVGSLALVSIIPLWPPRSSSVPAWLGSSLDFENYVVWAGSSLFPYLSCYSCLGVSVHSEWISNRFTLGGGPICRLPHGGYAPCPDSHRWMDAGVLAQPWRPFMKVPKDTARVYGPQRHPGSSPALSPPYPEVCVLWGSGLCFSGSCWPPPSSPSHSRASVILPGVSDWPFSSTSPFFSKLGSHQAHPLEDKSHLITNIIAPGNSTFVLQNIGKCY